MTIISQEVKEAADEQPKKCPRIHDKESPEDDRISLNQWKYLKYYLDGQIAILNELCEDLREVIEQQEVGEDEDG